MRARAPSRVVLAKLAWLLPLKGAPENAFVSDDNLHGQKGGRCAALPEKRQKMQLRKIWATEWPQIFSKYAEGRARERER